MRSQIFAVGLAAGLAAGTATWAAEVEVRIENGVLSFVGGQSYTNATLQITGPGDFELEETAVKGLPVFRAKNSGRLKDGLYQFSLIAATDEKETIPAKENLDNGRGSAARDYRLKPFYLSGAFYISEGTMKDAEAVEGGADKDSE